MSEHQLQLSRQMIESLLATLKSADAHAEDNLVAAQYLAATVGYLVGVQEIPSSHKQDLLEQLGAFSGQVMRDVMSQMPAAPPPQEAFGLWRPGE
jgi:hypothetical protein